MIIWSLDPGLRATGVAEHVNKLLTACALCRAPNRAPNPDLAALELQAEQAALWFLGRPKHADLIVVEWPVVYGGPRDEDPNDLLNLTAVNVGTLARLRAAGVKTPSRGVLAPLWTAGTPKGKRQGHYLDSLKPSEKIVLDQIKPASLRHNVIDSAHLGKWIAERIH